MRGFFQDPEAVALLLLAAHIFLVAVAAVLVSVNRRPSSAIAWVLAIIFIPLLGAVAYFFVGYAKLPKVAGTSNGRSMNWSWRGRRGARSSATDMTGRRGCIRR